MRINPKSFKAEYIIVPCHTEKNLSNSVNDSWGSNSLMSVHSDSFGKLPSVCQDQIKWASSKKQTEYYGIVLQVHSADHLSSAVLPHFFFQLVHIFEMKICSSLTKGESWWKVASSLSGKEDPERMLRGDNRGFITLSLVTLCSNLRTWDTIILNIMQKYLNDKIAQ